MRSVIVTDLTRFSEGRNAVCTAMLDMESGECYRPMPYLTPEFCAQNQITPGSILRGNFTFTGGHAPHIEDCFFDQLAFERNATSEEFRQVLEADLSPSVSEGFGVQFENEQKYIPYGTRIEKSIITIEVSPQEISLVRDRFNTNTIKVIFTDASGIRFPFLSITDRGFHRYAVEHAGENPAQLLQGYLSFSEHVYLRLGLSRRYQPNGDQRDGYWIQVNGIYTFPNFNRELRQI